MREKWKRFQPHLLVISLLSIFFLQNVVLAGTSGKIAGKVIDADTGEPLIGANIIILETSIGAAADVDGDYYMINISPGTYQLKVSMLGYAAQTITNVVVNTDRTTRLDIELVSESVSTQEVLVVAEKPVIRADLTASIVEVDAKQFEVKTQIDVQTLLKQQRGVIISHNQLGKTGNPYVGTPTDGLHIRGGRENETSFTLDGMVVTDPVWGGSEFIQNSSGNYIDEMTTLAGTFNAEYGNAMSGIVNIVTKDGSNQNYHGSINLFTDRVVDKYDQKTVQGVFSVGGPVPFTNNKLTFLVYGERRASDGYLYGYNYPNWSDSKGLDVDSVTKLPAGTGEEVSMDKSVYLNTSAKLKWTPTSTIRITAFGGYSELQRDYYDLGFTYYQAGMPHHESEDLFLNLNWTHTLSASTYYTVGFGYQNRDRFLGSFRDSLSYYDLNTELSESNNFWYSGEDWQHQNEESTTSSIRAAVVSQVNKGNLIKIGGQYRGINIKFFDINPSGAPYTYYQNYDYEPIEIAAYIQDKMEFSSLGLIINLGVRFDSWDVNAPYLTNYVDLNDYDSMKDSEVKTAISPRLGISYPISDVAAFHFAYGHFYQMPAYNFLYQGHRYLTSSDDVQWNNIPDRRGMIYRGITEEWHYFQPNTNMNPEKTVAYEAGVQIKLSENVALDLTAFYRDISDQIGQRFLPEGNNGNGMIIMDNFDYGNAKGVEISIDKRFSNYWGLRLNYTFTNSQTTSSTPWTKLQIDNPTYKTYTSDWDQPHTLNFDLYVGLPQKWDLTFSGSYSTGLPYTITGADPNTERSPYFAQFNFRLSKTFEVWGIQPQLYLNVLNLFDRQNIYGVYPSSGQPDLPLNVERTPLNLSKYDDPSNYGPGRQVYFGAAISF